MFSMKYTSPRVSPKKAAPPLDLLPSSPLDTTGGGRTSAENGDISTLMHTGGLDGLTSPSESAIIARSMFDAQEAENDSAVANVSEEIAPRSNLQALLDRELDGGTGSGEEMKKNTVQNDAESTSRDGDGADEPVVTNDCGMEGESKSDAIPDQIQDEIDFDEGRGQSTEVESKRSFENGYMSMEDEVDFDQEDGTVGLEPLHPKETLSPMSLAKGYPLVDRREGSFDGYRRTDSMEPMFGARSAEESAPPSQASMSGSEDVTDALAMPILGEETRTKPPSPPTIYDMSDQPVSPIMSAVNGDQGGNYSMPMDSPASRATESDIGGDTYFDMPKREQRVLEEQRPSSDSIEDDLVHVTLPPRVNRTTSNAAPFPMQSPLPMSPRPQFTHTHSLLDDCSDEEETSFTIVDSPTRHMTPYACIPPRAPTNSEGSSPFSSYFKKPQHIRKRQNSLQSSASNATQVASNNIQLALLQTRHRRWDCQSAYAGAHAQSNQVFDLSSRVVNAVGDSARLSVSAEAVRAAALASGLWRTVRLVRLPRGLFWTNGMDGEVWTLLKMMHHTFPQLDSVDFGGDISAGAKSSDDMDVWRDEVLACIMECLPDIVAIDGYVVDSLGAESRDSNGPSSEEAHDHHESNDAIQSSSSEKDAANLVSEDSAVCVDCETPMCGLSDLVDNEARSGLLNSSISDEETHTENESDSTPPSNEMAKGSDANEHISPNLAGDRSSSATDLLDTPAKAHESSDDEGKEMPMLSPSSSMLSSSGSWGGNGSGSRPPPCPSSASRQRPRISTKPAVRKRTKGGRLRRRVLGLIPSSSSSLMDEDEEDDESDDSEGDAAENDCPTDIL